MRIPTHPGKILREEFLGPLGLSARKLAGMIGVPPNRISEIMAERRDVSADTANRLAAVFGTSAEFWINLQVAHDLSKAKSENAKAYQSIKPLDTALLQAAR